MDKFFFAIRSTVLGLVLRVIGVRKLYREVVETDRLQDIRPKIRQDLQRLLESVDQNNPYFQGKFSEFLAEVADADDDRFFERFSTLPVLTKQDYAEAGPQVMPSELGAKREEMELQFTGNPLRLFWRLIKGDFLLPMATGGSTSLPLAVYMTKHHMFSMLFTFFKCWHRMGWRLGDKILVFYPRNTYNIDDMAKLNWLSGLSGFRIHLFDEVDLPTIQALVAEMNRFRPKMLLVFPSPMNLIAHTIRKHDLPLDYHPELINVSGETFFDCQRRNIQEVFNRSKIEDSYGSVELGEIAHEAQTGLEIFANVAYVENRANEEGMQEMIITRLKLADFPFIRYQMKDVAQVDFSSAAGKQQFLVSQIEGKDSNYILSHDSKRLYPSFFNQLVNVLNEKFEDNIIEIKVYERGQKELEVLLIVKQARHQEAIERETCLQLQEKIGSEMDYNIRFVDRIDHDYRKKYRVIQRLGDVEYAGGIVGDETKLANIGAET